ncbi:MAG: biotin synthase BioB [Peptoniphilus lacydonensis]|uniref:biotin synthase BioB n=1 Tax=Peptoniphilus lacydonensis TaxID=1673725 RepID=UPI0025857A17|nr:biotin synthase BioB [Peptoniphilus lacydonensis]MDU2115971.1 biotin synthase BioB [Peptoniphilus lacydonensis]MDU7302954.1 biotin synthase BioB [Peptoniphilus lacydonensis]
MDIFELKEEVKNGYEVTREEAIEIYKSDYEKLTSAANELREYFCGNDFDICTIINAKSGKCSENCKFCAQSSHYKTRVKEYDLLDKETIVEDAVDKYNRGVPRFSMVASGKSLTEDDIEKICDITREIYKRAPGIRVCLSGGLISQEGFKKLKDAGIKRVHNNLETSRNYFKEICTTHSYDQKINTIKAAQASGMEICSGGLIGLGESFIDRIDMALELRDLNIKSVPVNLLNPVKNTPLENNEKLSMEEVNRTCATYRFILKDAFIRLAGGRALMDGFGKSAFRSGANATISGVLLTTEGPSIEEDIETLEKLNFNIKAV